MCFAGVDIAYVENGYVYHTHYDRVEQIQRGTLQRSGENLLALIYGILTSPEFHNLGKQTLDNLQKLRRRANFESSD